MEKVTIHDKTFRLSIPNKKITLAIKNMATQINNDYKGKDVLFLVILNGAFMFAAELLKNITLNSFVSFIKLSSYEGLSSSGKIKQLIGLDQDLEGKNIIILEDIVDTGNTISHIYKSIKEQNPESIAIATLTLKPHAYSNLHKINYRGLEISNKFIVGFGLDYNGLGRNLPAIYQLNE